MKILNFLKKSWRWIIIIILCIAGMLFIASQIHIISWDKKDKPDSLAILKSQLSDKQSALSEKEYLADSLQKVYNECHGIMTASDSIAYLQAQLSDLKGKKPKVVYRCCQRRSVVVKKASKKSPDIQETDFVSFAPKKAEAPVVAVTRAETKEESPIAQYKGLIKGDYGTTIDDGSGRLVYFLKASLVSANGGGEAPHLNGKNGARFSLNSKIGYWLYVDGQVMSANELNSWSYAHEWNVFIGMVDYGTGSYEAYLPHQMIKPLLNRARGKEWGEITDEDLTSMRKLNSSIWTPSSEGTLRPFRLNKTGGRAYGKEDNQLYQGWNFRTKIVAVMK